MRNIALLILPLLLLAACGALDAAAPPGALEPQNAGAIITTAGPGAVASSAAYPRIAAEAATAVPQAYIAPAQTPTGIAALPPTPAPAYPGSNVSVYMPITGASPPTAPGEPSAAAPGPSPSPVPTVDFAAVQADLRERGEELGFVKIGFHVTLLKAEETAVLDNWLARLDEAGVPLFIKTVDNAEPLYKAQELGRASGVPHVLVYRSTGAVPHYELPPEQAAQLHWEYHRDLFPPELDPDKVWIETLNEPDRTRAEWLGRFALETARLAMADGFRWAAFGWAAGEPEPEQWQTPSMQAFLRLAAENPDKLAVAVHEYSYLEEEIDHEYPYKIGRFQALYEITDNLGLPRPTVLITEWGWEHDNIPDVQQAIDDIAWAAKLYAAYPQVQGAAVWNLGVGCCFGDISEQVQKIIDPLTDYSLTNYFTLPQGQQPVDPARFRR